MTSSILPLATAAQRSVAPPSLTGTISGIVVDSANQTQLTYVTVDIMETEKSRTLKSTLSNENGFFTLTELSPLKQYHLTLTYSGYRPVTLQVPPFTTSSVHLGKITLVSLAIQLKEVQVTSPKPLLEQSLDKLTYNVEADPESMTASALDILRKIPLFSIDAEDNIQLNGNSNYRVLINGKSSSLFLSNQSELFKNLSASIIKTIEVITVPPSRYEASGVGSIINITTYKKTFGGYNGGLTVRASNPGGLSTSGNLAAKKGKLSFSTSFSHTNSTSPANSHTLIRSDKIRHTGMEQTGNSRSHNWTQNGSAELSYELNDLNLLTIGYGTNRGQGASHNNQQVVLLNSISEPKEAYQRLNDSRNKYDGSDLNVDYQRTFKNNEDRQLSLTYSLSNSTNISTGSYSLQPLTNNKAVFSITDNEDGYREQTLKADYIQPLKNHTLELGISAVQRHNSSNYFYKDQDTTTGAFVPDSAQSNSFNYKEDIYAAYTSLNLNMGKWGIRTGARLEKAKVDGLFLSSGTAAGQLYTNLVPTLTLSRQFKGISTLRLSYSQRIQRPDLYYLDPYVDRTDPWNISYGNPGLKPALAQVFTLAYNTSFKKSSINLHVFHQFTNNAIQQYTVLDADTVARTTFGNIGRSQNTSFSSGFNTTLFKKLNINLNSNANYVEYTSTINGKIQNRKGLTYGTSGTASLRLKTWRFSSTMSYNAPNILVQGKSASYISNSCTLNKFFLKNSKASLSLLVSSPFRQHRRSFTEINEPAFYQLRSSYTVIRRFALSFNYRFVKVQDSSAGNQQ